MPRVHSKITCLAILSSCLVVAGCDSGANNQDPAAAAAEAKAKEDAELQKRIAARRAEREAKEKAKQEEEQKKQEAIAAVAVLPEKLPKKLDQACEGVWEAQQGFMERLYGDNPETVEKWKAAAGTQKPMTITTCKKAGSIEAAACQIHALENAPPELKKELPAILRYCIDKFAGGPPPGSATPPG